MSPLVFGRDDPPPESSDRMAYVARAACGHIVIAQADTRPTSLQEFIGYGLAGLTVERIPAAQVREEGFGNCDRCRPPEQIGLAL